MGNNFICAIGSRQYLEMNGELYEAPRDAQLDPDGYPYGMLSHRGISNNLTEFIEGLARWEGHKEPSLKFEAPDHIMKQIEEVAEAKRRAKEEAQALLRQRMNEYAQRSEKRSNIDNEEILSDDYPVFFTYWYVVDGMPQRSDIQGTIADLKRDTGASEVRRCDAIKRGLRCY